MNARKTRRGAGPAARIARWIALVSLLVLTPAAASASIFVAPAPDTGVAISPNPLAPEDAIESEVEPIRIGDMLFPSGSTLDAGFTGNTWPGGNVFYTFAIGTDPAEQAAFLAAAHEWTKVANVTFSIASHHNPDYQGDYILVIDSGPDGPNEAFIGRKGGGSQPLRISAWGSQSVILHEIGHALGLLHEHMRSDRNSYVQILTDNIESGMGHNFNRVDNSVNVGAYDFDSIMGYPPCAYSRDCSWCLHCTRPTIVPLPAYADDAAGMGFAWRLSDGDAAGMAARYGATLCRTPDPQVPSGNARCVATSGSLRWGSIGTASRYRVQLATSLLFAPATLVLDSQPTSSSVSYSGLDRSRTYYWRVAAQTPRCGWGEFSPASTFTTEPPAVASTPVPTFPSNGATNQPADGLLRCTAVSGATSYSFVVRCPLGEVVLNANVITPAVLYHLEPGRYEWTVSATNGCDATPRSQPVTFSVLNAVPCSVPALVSPSNGTSCVPDSGIWLRWAPLPNVSSYVVELARGTGGPKTKIVTGSEYFAEPLEEDAEYTWRVRANCLCSEFSAARSFRTVGRAPRQVDQLITPEDGARDLPLATTLTWNPIDGATGYRVRLGSACGVGEEIDTAMPRLEVSDLLPGTTYMWQVQAKDSCNQWGRYGSCRDFETLAWRTGVDRFYPAPGLRFGRGQAGVRIPVRMENLSAVSRVELTLRVDPLRLRIVGWTAVGTRSEAALTKEVNFNNREIRARFDLAEGDACPPQYEVGDGVLIEVLADVLPDAPVGLTLLDLSAGEARRCGGGSLHAERYDVFVEIEDSTVGVNPGSRAHPQSFVLSSAFPNPMRARATLQLGMPSSGDVVIDVFNLAGRRVARLFGGQVSAGWSTIAWDGRDDEGRKVAPGVYFVRGSSNLGSVQQRLIVLP